MDRDGDIVGTSSGRCEKVQSVGGLVVGWQD